MTIRAILLVVSDESNATVSENINNICLAICRKWYVIRNIKNKIKKQKSTKKKNKVTNNHFNYLFLFQIALFLAVLFK